jgi:predicted membrane protein
MNQQRQRPMPSRLVVGMVIAAIGAILLLGNLGWFDAREVLRTLWPLALVAAGVAMLRDPKQRRGHAGAWVLITVGAWIFADKIGLIFFNVWELIVPGILLFVGGMLVWRAVHEQQSRNPGTPPGADSGAQSGEQSTPQRRLSLGEEQAEFVRSFAFMSYTDLHPVSQPFSGGDLNAVMGGIKLDLRDTRMEGEQAILDVFAFWGGIEIHVPPDWIVTSKVTTIIGGFVDGRRPSKVVPTKTLIIRGFNLMSGIEVKN